MKHLILPILLASTSTLAAAQCDGIDESFESYPLSQGIDQLANWSVSGFYATVQPDTVTGNSKVMQMVTPSGYVIADRTVPGNVATGFDIKFEAKMEGFGGFGITCSGGTGSLAGFDFNSTQSNIFCSGSPNQGLTLNPGFGSLRAYGEIGGTVTITYNGQTLCQEPWPVSCGGVQSLRWDALGLVGITSMVEVDDICMGHFQLGSIYCSSNPNSTGVETEIIATGSTNVVDNDLELTMTSMPLNQFGYFLTSLNLGYIANAGGSQGNLCLGGTIGRFLGPGQTGSSGANGQLSLDVDLTMIPQQSSAVAVLAGQTWRFQGWHRDVVMGSNTSNFSNAVRVTFQ